MARFSRPDARPRLVYMITHPVGADVLMRGQLAFMRERGFDVHLITSPGEELDRVRRREQVETIAIPMERSPNPLRDLASLAELTRTLRRLRPHIVNAG